MSPFPWSDLVIIAGLIVLNGLFSMSELAIVSARPARLRKMSEDGSKGAKAALALAAPVFRRSLEDLVALTPELTTTAAAIAARLPR